MSVCFDHSLALIATSLLVFGSAGGGVGAIKMEINVSKRFVGN